MEAYWRSLPFLQLQPLLRFLRHCLRHQLLRSRSRQLLRIIGEKCASLVLNATALASRTKTAKSNIGSLFSILPIYIYKMNYFLLNKKKYYLQIFPMRHQSPLRTLLDKPDDNLNDYNSPAPIHDSYSCYELSQNRLSNPLARYLHQLFWWDGSCCDSAAAVSVSFHKPRDGNCDWFCDGFCGPFLRCFGWWFDNDGISICGFSAACGVEEMNRMPWSNVEDWEWALCREKIDNLKVLIIVQFLILNIS